LARFLYSKPVAAARLPWSLAKKMLPELSVHDNHLVAYTVLANERKIVLQTVFRDREPNEFTDVVFDEVLAYHFENDLFGTIIFDIEEVDLTALLKEHAAMFEKGWHYGWPRGWEKQKEEITDFARRLDMRAFELSASYGMSGWIIARRMIKIKNEANKAMQPTPVDVTDRAGARSAPSTSVADL